MAAWALTIMNGGGTALVPFAPFRRHDEALAPAQPLVRWHYTDFADPRWALRERLLRLRCDALLSQPQKAGLLNVQGWCAYARQGELFIKQFPCTAGAPYPDFNCNNEFFTAGSFIETESLGPLATVEPGESLTHVERWSLHRVALSERGDAEVIDQVQKLLA